MSMTSRSAAAFAFGLMFAALTLVASSTQAPAAPPQKPQTRITREGIEKARGVLQRMRARTNARIKGSAGALDFPR